MKIKLKQALIVEGRYDKIALENIVEAVIIPLNGFGIYNDNKTVSLIKKYAETTGIIILTDADNAGRQIRNYIKDKLASCKNAEVLDAYIPENEVEDAKADVLREALKRFALSEKSEASRAGEPVNASEKITRQRLFDDGLIGGVGSAAKRKSLLKKLALPENLSTSALLNAVNLYGLEKYEELIGERGAN